MLKLFCTRNYCTLVDSVHYIFNILDTIFERSQLNALTVYILSQSIALSCSYDLVIFTFSSVFVEENNANQICNL